MFYNNYNLKIGGFNMNYVENNLEFLDNYDPQVASAMKAELGRQRRNLELIASENIVSPAVMAAMGSILTNKYAEGYPDNTLT